MYTHICVYTCLHTHNPCVSIHTRHTLKTSACASIPSYAQTQEKTAHPQTHTACTHTRTHTPVAIDPHFLHRHTATPAAHTQIYRSAHDSPLGRRKCMCTAAHRRPVRSCVDGPAQMQKRAVETSRDGAHTHTHAARAGENRRSFH